MDDWRALCRTCGISINEELDFKLFEEQNYLLVTIIQDIADMWIENDNTLPDYICIKCKSFLEEIIEFRANCLDTHKKLIEAKKKYIQNITNNQKLYEDSFHPDSCDKDEINVESGKLPQKNSISHCKASKAESPKPTKNSAQGKIINKTKTKHGERNTKAKTWICEQCGGEFKCSTYLKLHMLRHTGNKQFECDICKSRYYTQNEMIRHRMLHSKTRPYSCRFCDKTFRGTSSKAVHERTHTNERPFACQYCEKTFTSTSVRKMHERLHNKNRQYHCEPCDQWFVRSSHLSLHQRTKLHKSKTAGG